MPEFDFSPGYARFKAAMSTGCHDAPLIAQMHEFSMRESGIPADVFYIDARTFVRDICKAAQRFGFDTPSFIWDAYNIEAEAIGATLVQFKDMVPAIVLKAIIERPRVQQMEVVQKSLYPSKY